MLVDQIRQHGRPELRQRFLNIAATQVTSGSSALEQGAFPLFDLRLEFGAGGQLVNRWCVAVRRAGAGQRARREMESLGRSRPRQTLSRTQGGQSNQAEAKENNNK